MHRLLREAMTKVSELTDPDRAKILELRQDIERIDFNNWVNSMTARLLAEGPIQDLPFDDYDYYDGMSRDLQRFAFFAVLGAWHDVMWEQKRLTDHLIEAGIIQIETDDE